jgi:hypothetical protein
MGRTTMTSVRAVLIALVAIAGVTACTPQPVAHPTRLAITTRLTWCGGVIPPPGESWCHESFGSREISVSVGRVVVTTGTSGADGKLVLDVAPGRYLVAAVNPPSYMECDTPSGDVVAGATTSVVQTCSFFAP